MTTATESPATEEHVTAEATPRSGDNLSLKSGIEEEDGELGDLKEEDEPASGREGGEISDDVAALQDELNKITVAAPTVGVSEYFDSSEFPQSFKENNPKEKLILAYAENFRRQYVHLYRDRKPLFLNPNNECDLEKLVCTTIRPTQLPYKELYDWDCAAEFVADYLNFTMLEPAHELPVRLLSPTTIMKRQKGNCFEYSTLLVSLLVAAGYDAYVVSGYASRETCLMDETREICPLLKKKEESKPMVEDEYEEKDIQKEEDEEAGGEEQVKEETKKRQQKKYTVRPPKDLRSKFELKQEARRQQTIADEEEVIRKEELARQLEAEKPPTDPLHGLRVHSWVLVLEGKREIPESFFIEPLTGLPHAVNSDNYLGIESVWNHQNYWVNMQDCSEGVRNMNYDLGDCAQWEFMFPSNDKPSLQLPDEEDMLEDDEEEEQEVEKHLDMPPSWVPPIELGLRDFQMRCPQGKKSKLYKRAKLEKFAHYLMKDGLVCRLSVYTDRELTDLVQVKEFYSHREDKLQERIHNQHSGWITEHYAPGRHRCLREHQYKGCAPGPENDRTMIFYHDARVDGLHKRVETPTEMTEHFINRDDFLYYRFIQFTKRAKKFGPAESANVRPIVKMVKRYHRNPALSANEDVAELVFFVSEERVQVTYHTEVEKISASSRDFIKPANTDEKGAILQWHPDNHNTFQVDPSKTDKKKVELYQMMVDLVKAEEKCRERAREAEEEVQEILNDRTREEVASELDISVYDTERNEKAKRHRLELERIQMEEKMRREEMELDYLAPFLAQIGDPEKINRSQAFKLKEDCLLDLKRRLIDKANLIQVRFEKETQELQKKQAWYQQNQVSMQKDDEEEYLNYCSEAMFRIHILELRLNRHKEMAPQKYMALDQKIRSDQRLAEFF